MRRDLKELTGRQHDLLIIGGGIYGAAAAREGALSGLSVALIDKADFGGATSANSLKLIHGGLRYLQQADIIRMRESITERRIMQMIAPHLVSPLACVMPTRRGALLKSPLAMSAALLANDIVSFDRNRGIDPSRHLGRGSVISKEDCLKLVPGIDSTHVSGGAVWHDALAFSTERLTVGMVRAAAAADACVANYVKATGFVREKDSIIGVQARDMLAEQDIVIRAKLVINNTGPWAVEALTSLGGGISMPDPQLAMGMNFVLLREPISTHAVGLVSEPGAGLPGRLLFFVPWRGRCMVGTYYREHQGLADNMSVHEEDIGAFLADINRACPSLAVTADDIGFIHAGLLPAITAPTDGSEPRMRRHCEVIDHELRDGVRGLITVRGVKYTTARRAALQTTRLAARRLGRSLKSSNSAIDPIPGGDLADIRRFEVDVMPGLVAKMGQGVAGHLLKCYGSEYRSVLDEAGGDPAQLAPLGESSSVIGAEILFSIRREMALTLSDIVFRRTELATCAMPSDNILRRAAEIAAAELNWSPTRATHDIAAVQSAFAHP